MFFPFFGLSVFWILLLVFVAMASRFFLAFCVYSDARYRQDDNAVLWGILSGFVSLAALIYIIIKVSSPHQFRRCVQCGEIIAPDGMFCPRCGREVRTLSEEDKRRFDQRRKLFFGLWIGSLVLFFIAIIVFIGVFMSQMAFTTHTPAFR